MPMNIVMFGPYECVLTRRRYSNCTFCWVDYKAADGTWVQLGDPWQSINPRRAEVLRDIAADIAYRQSKAVA